MSTSTSSKNLGYIIAVAGGIVALFAFFFMPYVNIPFGIFGGSLTGQQLANVGSQYSQYSSQLSGLQLLWLEPIIALILAGIAGWQIYKSSTTGVSSSQGAVVALISIASIMALILIGRYIYDTQPIVSQSSFGESTSIPGLASYYGSGVWLYLIGIIAAGVGGIIQARTSASSASVPSIPPPPPPTTY